MIYEEHVVGLNDTQHMFFWEALNSNKTEYKKIIRLFHRVDEWWGHWVTVVEVYTVTKKLETVRVTFQIL